MGCSLGTVKSTTARALERLREDAGLRDGECPPVEMAADAADDTNEANEDERSERERQQGVKGESRHDDAARERGTKGDGGTRERLAERFGGAGPCRRVPASQAARPGHSRRTCRRGDGGNGYRRRGRGRRSRRLRRMERDTDVGAGSLAGGGCELPGPAHLHARRARVRLGSGAWQNVLTDVRGPFTVALFQDDGTYAACFTSSSFTVINQISSGGAAGSSSGSVSVRSGNGANSPAGVGGAMRQGRTSVVMDGTSSGDLQHVVQTQLSTTGRRPLHAGRRPGCLGRHGSNPGRAMTARTWWPPCPTDGSSRGGRAAATATSSQVSKASGTISEQLEPLSMPLPGSGPTLGSGGPLSGSGTTEQLGQLGHRRLGGWVTPAVAAPSAGSGG